MFVCMEVWAEIQSRLAKTFYSFYFDAFYSEAVYNKLHSDDHNFYLMFGISQMFLIRASECGLYSVPGQWELLYKQKLKSRLQYEVCT